MKSKLVFLFMILCAFTGFSQNGVIQGRVFDGVNNDPLPFATILVLEVGAGAYSDSTGRYEIKGLKPGLYNVEARYNSYKSLTKFEIQVTNSRPTEVDFPLESEETLLEDVVIIASPFNKTAESPVSIRTIGVNEIARNPGGNRDISRVIQSLPGVSSSVGFRNDIIIRGGAPNENRFYIDDIEIPNINHFSTQGASGGPVGLINVDFIREVDLITGAFPANRANTISSVMNIKLKNGRDDRVGFTSTVGSSDFGVTLEGPIGKKTTFLVSARTSYLQLLFKVLGLPFLPNYNDFQFKTKTKFDNKNELTVLGLGAVDLFKLNLQADSTDSQRYLLGNLPVNNQWNYTIGAKYRRFTDNGFWMVVASRNMLNNRVFKYQDNDDSDPDKLITDYLSREIENRLRIENNTRVQGFKVNVGVNLDYSKFTSDTYAKISVPGGVQTIDFDSKLNVYKYGLFGSVSRNFFEERLVMSAGFRMDGNSYSKQMSLPWEQFSPRFSLSYNVHPKVSLNFNTGLYYQLPPYTVMGYRDAENELVNKANRLKYIKSTQVVGGVEYNYTASGKITVEGFYKHYDRYPFLLRDSISLANLGGDFGVIGAEPINSTSRGRAYGLEFMVQQKLIKGFFGILSYTLVRSEFTDGTKKFKPSAWDNGNIISLTAGKKFKRNWEIGVKWRYYGATPFTPYDVQTSALQAVWDVRGAGLFDYSRLNEGRLPATHGLDLRVDKKWFFKKWSLNLYLDVQNAYFARFNLQPFLDVQRDENGAPIADPNNPGSYQMRTFPNESGTLLPSIGIVVQI